MTRPLCERCRQRPRKPYHTARLCVECGEARKRRPLAFLEPWQAARVRAWNGEPRMRELAAELGVSLVTVQRYRTQEGLSTPAHRYDEATRRDVLAFYEQHGRPATQEAFPHVNVRSIIERYPHAARWRPWRPDELVQLARMGGLVPAAVQAALLARPGAGPQSIYQGWVKHFGQLGGRVHGLHPHQARHILRPGYPVLELPHWIRRKGSAPGAHKQRRLVLWVDIPPWVRPELPAFLREAFDTLAQFQVWLFAPEDPARAIRAMVAKHGGRALEQVACGVVPE